jgi:hypothetical protein
MYLCVKPHYLLTSQKIACRECSYGFSQINHVEEEKYHKQHTVPWEMNFVASIQKLSGMFCIR